MSKLKLSQWKLRIATWSTPMIACNNILKKESLSIQLVATEKVVSAGINNYCSYCTNIVK